MKYFNGLISLCVFLFLVCFINYFIIKYLPIDDWKTMGLSVLTYLLCGRLGSFILDTLENKRKVYLLTNGKRKIV